MDIQERFFTLPKTALYDYYDSSIDDNKEMP